MLVLLLLLKLAFMLKLLPFGDAWGVPPVPLPDAATIGRGTTDPGAGTEIPLLLFMLLLAAPRSRRGVVGAAVGSAMGRSRKSVRSALAIPLICGSTGFAVAVVVVGAPPDAAEGAESGPDADGPGDGATLFPGADPARGDVPPPRLPPPPTARWMACSHAAASCGPSLHTSKTLEPVRRSSWMLVGVDAETRVTSGSLM